MQSFVFLGGLPMYTITVRRSRRSELRHFALVRRGSFAAFYFTPTPYLQTLRTRPAKDEIVENTMWAANRGIEWKREGVAWVVSLGEVPRV